MAVTSCVGRPEWSDLPLEILELILEKLRDSIKDIKRFKAVCRWWRKAAKSYIWCPFPWVVLRDAWNDTESKSFYNFEEGKTYELENMSNTYARDWVVLGSSCGWLVIYELTFVGRFIYRLTLFNPCSRVKLVLPSVENILLPSNYNITADVLLSTKAILLSDPSRTENWRVLAVSSEPNITKLVIYINGRSEWIEFGYGSWYEDILWHNDKLYALIFGGTVDVWKFNENDNLIPTKVVSFVINTDHIKNLYPAGNVKVLRKICHLVGSLMGDVLFVVQTIVDMPPDHQPTLHFHVYKLDYSGKKWEKLQSLGDQNLFLTADRTSMSANSARNCSRFQKNSIYFISWIPELSLTGASWTPNQKLYVGVYNLEEKVAKRFYKSDYTMQNLIGRTSTWIHIEPKPKPSKGLVFLYFIPILPLALWFFGRKPKLF